MASWIQHPITGELVPRNEYVRPCVNGTAAVHGDLESFLSPIDRSVITDRRQLREHNKRHGVTNSADYGDNYGEKWFKRKAAERKEDANPFGKKAVSERRETINQAIDKHNYENRGREGYER
jgi:hypothetical protein